MLNERPWEKCSEAWKAIKAVTLVGGEVWVGNNIIATPSPYTQAWPRGWQSQHAGEGSDGVQYTVDLTGVDDVEEMERMGWAESTWLLIQEADGTMKESIRVVVTKSILFWWLQSQLEGKTLVGLGHKIVVDVDVKSVDWPLRSTGEEAKRFESKRVTRGRSLYSHVDSDLI
jgi:hypothetical protein